MARWAGLSLAASTVTSPDSYVLTLSLPSDVAHAENSMPRALADAHPSLPDSFSTHLVTFFVSVSLIGQALPCFSALAFVEAYKGVSVSPTDSLEILPIFLVAFGA